MLNTEKYKLWQNTELSEIAPNLVLVRNDFDSRIMALRKSGAENFEIMRALCSVRHLNIMRVYDAVTDGNVCKSLCEFIDGLTLEKAVENFCPYKEKQVRDIMCQLCDGLSALHERGIIHRDINPTNIMITWDGIIKIIDFDITRTVKFNRSKDTRVLGTAGYASPEQFGFSQTNERADIYSCGVLMNYLLTGALPNERHAEGPLSAVIKRCTQIDENNRFQNAEQLKKALLSIKSL
ncbi:MAG: serine/threonine protein kinase [Ruminococcus sp.]|nr:serine/threonine protein kinase [Ruminococcus sp.]